MVVNRLALDVGMVAAREVNPLNRIELGEQLECPEDRSAPDVETPFPGIVDEVCCCEMTASIGDQPGHDPARLGESVAGSIQHIHDRRVVGHAPTIPRNHGAPRRLLTIPSLT